MKKIFVIIVLNLIMSCSLWSNSSEGKLSNLDKDLQWAISKGHFARVKRLIDKGADINLVNGEIEPVLFSIKNGHDEIASYLIKKGANLEIRSTMRYTPLLYVCYKGSAGYAEFLVDHGADVKKTNYLFQKPLDLLIDNSVTNISMPEATKKMIDAGAEINKETLEKALFRKKDYRTIQLILEKLVDQGDSTGLPFLFDLVILNKTDKLKLLLEYGVDLKVKVHGNSVLSFASAVGTPEIMELLIEYGVDINNDRSNDEMYTPLMIASQYGNFSVVNFLINKGADVNGYCRKKSRSGTISGETALELAVEFNYTKIAKLLINKGASIYPAPVKNWQNKGYPNKLFVRAIINENIELMKLLEKNGLQLKPQNYTYYMDRAIGNFTITKYMLEKGATPNHVDTHGDSYLSIAAKGGNLELYNLLLKYGAKINYKKDNVLFEVIKSKNERKNETVKWLLKKGANVNTKEYGKDSIYGKGSVNCLIYASREGDLEMVKLLVNNGAKINYYSTLWTHNALTAATKNYYIDVSKYLVKKGIDLNKKTERGFTALMMAVSANDIDFVKFLIKHGANVSIKNKIRDRSYTALDIANEMKKSNEEINPEIISLLKMKMRRR